MDLIGETASPGDIPVRRGEMTEHGPSPQEAAARLFRSVRAGRSWLRAQGAAVASPSGALVTMKPGQNGPPLLMIPGAPGSILQLGPLAAAMPAPIPVYAIKPRGLDGGEEPCETIREMAEYAIAALQALRPAGPYLLMGYSAGGLVALEVAQSLVAAGHAVPLVVLIDTYPGRRVWPLRCHADVLGRQAFRALWALTGYSPAAARREVQRRLRSLRDYLAASGVAKLPPAPVAVEGTSVASRRVYLATYNAGEAYRPSRYDGKVLFVQPDEVPNLEPRSPHQVWRRFLGDLEVCRIDGTTHLGIVETGVAATAAAVCGSLERAVVAFQRGLGTKR